MRYLVLPTKNVFLGQSIIGVASIIYQIIKNNDCSIDEVYEKIKQDYINNKLKYSIDFNQYVLGLCFLYSIRKIEIKENGVIYCETN